ncbi:MAG: type III-A CRISPR-associated protein Cas10/Csm1 [candidate division KSB1 bacterium]|nr:type III-A CRISPR-associated protein Cas10/Csm1 [candidate division KSB1 bacterium]
MVTEEHTLWLAALLHDIGKFAQRASDQGRGASHAEFGRRFVEEMFAGYFAPCGDYLAHAVAHHHTGSPQRDIEKLVMLADCLSASEREEEERHQEAPSWAPMVSMFSRPPLAPEGTTELRFALGPLNWADELTFFPRKDVQVGPPDYAVLWEHFVAEFRTLAGERGYHPHDLTTILALLRKYTSRMPSATPWGKGETRTVPDVSLYDHLKSTAAIAACLYRELGPDSYDVLLKALRAASPGQEDLQLEVCALLKGDISGTQDFLYLMSSSGASRGLRGRSFYLQLLTETVAGWVLERLGLPLTNLLFAGGGHFYLLLPFRQTQELFPQLDKEVTEKLWRAHQGDLCLLMDYVPVALCDFLEAEQGGHAFSEKWSEVSERVNAAKQRKWGQPGTTWMSEVLFRPRQLGTTEEEVCQVCHGQWEPSVDMLVNGVRKCRRCESFEELGRKLRQPSAMLLLSMPERELPDRPTWDEVLAAFGRCPQVVAAAGELVPPQGAATSGVFYRFDSTEFLQSKTDAERLFGDLPMAYDFRLLADATPAVRDAQGSLKVAEFADLAQASEGVKWLGVLRMDVDDLGSVFRSGLAEHASLSRLCTLSETLRLFFEGWVPTLFRSYNPVASGSNGEKAHDAVYLIYAGGDDLFAVGAWSVLPEVAAQVRDDFRRLVGGDHITLSAGIAVEHQKFPLYQLAEAAKEALDGLAKRYSRKLNGRAVKKDAIGFMGKAMGWEELTRAAEWKDTVVQMLRGDGKKAVPRALVTRLAEIAHLYEANARLQRARQRAGEISEEQLNEEVMYAKWMWQLVYHLGRFRARQEEHKEELTELQQAIIRQQDSLIPLLAVLARWTELLTREE